MIDRKTKRRRVLTLRARPLMVMAFVVGATVPVVIVGAQPSAGAGSVPAPKQASGAPVDGVGQGQRRSAVTRSAQSSLASPEVTGPAPTSALASGMHDMYEGAVMNGIYSAIGFQLFGWGLSAIGLSDKSSQTDDDLAAIEAELEAIQTELVTVNDSLQQINQTLEQQTCDDYTTSLSTYVSSLQSIYGEYEDLYNYNPATGTFGTDPSPSLSSIFQWVADATDSVFEGKLPSLGTTSVGTDLAEIQFQLDPAGSGGEGLLSACIKAEGNPPAPGTFGDTSYYDTYVIPMEEYYYAYQLDAFEMLSEIYHVSAWVAAGEPTSATPDDIQTDVCPELDSSTPANLDCLTLRNLIETDQPNIVDQWEVGGAPYSDTTVTILNGANTLWPHSLTAFTQSGDASCAAPLTSDNPCGAAAGLYDMTSIDETYDGYDEWTAADAAQLETLLDPDSSNISGSTQTGYTDVWKTTDKDETPAAWLQGDGFGDLGSSTDSNLVIGCPDTGSGEVVLVDGDDDQRDYDFDFACFVDLGISYSQLSDFKYLPSPSVTSPLFTPADSSYGQSALGNYADLSPIGSSDCDTALPSWATSTSDNGYFDASYDMCADGGLGDWVDTPQWIAGSSKDVYHMPVIDVTDLSCSSGLSHSNPEGVPTMCGSNLQAYVSAAVPPVPSVLSFTSTAERVAPSTDADTPMTIELQNGSGTAATFTNPLTVDLSSSSSTGVFSNSSGGSSVTSVTLPVNSSSVTFYYGDDTDGASPTITVSSTNLVSAAQTEYVAGDPARLAFSTPARTGAPSSSADIGPVSVDLEDASGVPTTSSGATVDFDSPSDESVVFSKTLGGSTEKGAMGVSSSASATTSSYTPGSYTVYFGSTLAGTKTVTAAASIGNEDFETTQNEFVGSSTAEPSVDGYDEVASDGGVFSFGDASYYGSMGGRPLAAPVVGMALTEDRRGYYEVASDGGVFAFGDATFYGSMGGRPLVAPVVGMAVTADGKGYYEVASDGGVFAFGDATFYGSMGGRPLVAPVVGMALTADGKGYDEVASDGGVFAFGDATFYGSMGGRPLVAPVVGMALTADGKGYDEVASDGGVFSFGDAVFDGSMGGQPLVAPMVGMALAPDGRGYYEVASDGGIFAFGDAGFRGSMGGTRLNDPIVAMAR